MHMSPADIEQNETIFRILGWELDPKSPYSPVCSWRKGAAYTMLPDFVHNYTDMLTAERTLTPQQRRAYAAVLAGGSVDYLEWWRDLSDSDHLDALVQVANARPCDRAEAFLRVHGKWKDEWE